VELSSKPDKTIKYNGNKLEIKL
jgi:hypothetical protein